MRLMSIQFFASQVCTPLRLCLVSIFTILCRLVLGWWEWPFRERQVRLHPLPRVTSSQCQTYEALESLAPLALWCNSGIRAPQIIRPGLHFSCFFIASSALSLEFLLTTLLQWITCARISALDLISKKQELK